MSRWFLIAALVVHPAFWCAQAGLTLGCGTQAACCCDTGCGCEMEAPSQQPQELPAPPTRSADQDVSTTLALTPQAYFVVALQAAGGLVEQAPSSWLWLSPSPRALLCVWLT